MDAVTPNSSQTAELFPHLTVLSNVTIAKIKVLKRSGAAADEKARMLLARVGLSSRITKYPAQLSGGQQQRVAGQDTLALIFRQKAKPTD